MKRVFFIAVASYLISCSEAQQYDTTTDPAKCCKRVPNTTYADSTCRSTRLTANQFQQSITTPNYPKAFEADTFCRWEVFSIAGRRILLDFRNIHLVAKDNNECMSQKLMIRSPLTGLSLGPYCGHDGLPNMVTTGNHIVVELQSPQSTNGREYKGFQMVYMETVQATSIGLRPPDWSDGMYLEYQKPSPSTRPTRPSRFQPNRNKNLPLSTRRPPISQNKKKTLNPKEPKKKPPKERVLSNHNNLRNIAPAYPYIPPPRVPTRIREKPKEQETMGTEVIVGIVVGGIFLIAIISVIVAKVGFYRSAKRNKREEQDEELANQAASPNFPSGYKTSSLPSYWTAVSVPDQRPSKKHLDLKMARAKDRSLRKPAEKPASHQSRANPKPSQATAFGQTPTSRARTRTRGEKDKARSARSSDRVDRKKRTENSGASRRNPEKGDKRRSKRPSDGRQHKKPNGRGDR